MPQDPGAVARWLASFNDTERSGRFVYDGEASLARERALLALLGNPQAAYGITHVAGTKGKGSTCALLAAILEAAGLRVGLYTQPDLHTWHERLRLNGQSIAEAEAQRLLPQVQAALAQADQPPGSYLAYEVVTALAFLFFQQARAEHAVIEVGLGGRLDATNIVEPMATVITSISYDHMAVLGATLSEIAREKAGIIKPGVPLICAAQAPEAVEVIARVCAERGAPLLRVGPVGAPDCACWYQPLAAEADRQWGEVTTPLRTYHDLEIGLLGAHQLENAAAAITAAEQLQARGLPLDEAAIRRGLREARWPGRLQVVQRQPWVVVDGAHNADSFARLLAALRRHFAFERLILVVGVMADKDLPGIAAEIARAGVDRVIVTAMAHPRAAPPDRLARLLAAAADLNVLTCPETPLALAEGLRAAGADGLLCVTGSFALVGEALRWFNRAT